MENKENTIEELKNTVLILSKVIMCLMRDNEGIVIDKDIDIKSDTNKILISNQKNIISISPFDKKMANGSMISLK